jgi:hypothetical protein
MIVYEATAIGAPKPGGKEWFEPEGLCGFAWVTIKGTSAFAKWAKKQGLARPGYPTGLVFWVSEFGQSVARKEAFAKAFAAVLRSQGIEGAYADSRLD